MIEEKISRVTRAHKCIFFGTVDEQEGVCAYSDCSWEAQEAYRYLGNPAVMSIWVFLVKDMICFQYNL